MSETSIEWTDKTWNPVRGCSLVSEGCRRCYAMKQAHRFSGPGGAYEGLTELGPDGPRWTGKIRAVPELLGEPLKWRKPSRVFVNSMSDLFHEDVPDSFIDQVFVVMALAQRHTFQILTKRPARMLEYIQRAPNSESRGWDAAHFAMSLPVKNPLSTVDGMWREPLPNVWLGVSVEDQKTADERIPLLLQTPAAVRFISAEPLLGFVNLCRWIHADWSPTLGTWKYSPVKSGPALDWVIVGGESGPHSRELRPHWVRQIVGPCRAARVPVFVKQLGSFVVDRNDAGFDGNDGIGWPAIHLEENRIEDIDSGYQGAPVRIHLKDRKGGNPEEWPADLRCRQFPVTLNPQPPTVETR